MIKKRAVTFVEMTIGLAILSMVLAGVYRIFSHTRDQFIHGTVNLQSLEDARLAINNLRRDFSTACPYIDYVYDVDPNTDDTGKFWNSSIQDDYVNLQMLRRDIFNTGSAKGFKNDEKEHQNYNEAWPIHIVKDSNTSSLVFHHFVFQDNGECMQKPLVERVMYTFDRNSGILQREGSGRINTFKGFKDVDFSIYILDLKGDGKKLETNKSYQELPVLWVYFEIHDLEQKDERYGKPLELGTSIVSPYIASWMLNRRWRSDLGQEKIN